MLAAESPLLHDVGAGSSVEFVAKRELFARNRGHSTSHEEGKALSTHFALRNSIRIRSIGIALHAAFKP